MIVDRMPDNCRGCWFSRVEIGMNGSLSLNCVLNEKMYSIGLIDRNDRPEWCPLTREIVRCKDCKYYTPDIFQNTNGTNMGECHKLAIGLGVYSAEDWFCAEGTRKDGDEHDDG